LAEAERKIAYEEEEKQSIQDNLKKAFMRGVCAMNFEAMNILNPSTPMSDSFSNDNPAKVDSKSYELPQKANEASNKLYEFPSSYEVKFESPMEKERFSDKPDSDRIPLEEISMVLPSDSKELRWKAAPVFGRPMTAPERHNEPIGISGLPIITNTNQTEGKVIVVNNLKNTEAKITGKVPIKPVIGKKHNPK
jgi:centrosomal protein POC5